MIPEIEGKCTLQSEGEREQDRYNGDGDSQRLRWKAHYVSVVAYSGVVIWLERNEEKTKEKRETQLRSE